MSSSFCLVQNRPNSEGSSSYNKNKYYLESATEIIEIYYIFIIVQKSHKNTWLA